MIRFPASELPEAGRTTDALAWLDLLREPIWVFDIDRSRVFWANRSAIELWQADSLQDLTARELGADMSPAVRRRLAQYQEDFSRSNARFGEVWTLYPHGQPRHLDVDFSGVRLPDGRVAMFCEARLKETGDPATLRSAEALLHTEVMITLYTEDGVPLYRNPAARDAAPGGQQACRDRFLTQQDFELLMQQMNHLGQARMVTRMTTSRGERWHDLTARRCHDAFSGQSAWLTSEVDVTDLKHAEARAQYLAHHDLLTGLPNRNFVAHEFPRQLDRLAQRHEGAALIFIDLDQFKNINDSLGHSIGDELLVQLAQRLRAYVSDTDLVARLGGDEFVVLARNGLSDHGLEILVRGLIALLSQPVSLLRHEVRVTPSIGISLFPKDAGELDALMRQADLAMYEAKAKGRNGYAFFRPELRAAAQSRLAVETDLRRAIEAGELAVYYQPRASVRSGAIIGAEALLRWHHPEHGLIPPAQFVAVAEDCGLIEPIGVWVLEQVARQQARWMAQGLSLNISVNLSPRQFADRRLADTLRRIVADSGCDASRIELEITESVLLGHDGRTIAMLQELRELGFRFAVDDFGTGYSNLAYLQRYPIQCLKIDRSFIHALDTASPIAELILTLCRMMGLQAVAEGVETVEQLRWLAERNCDEYQGYLVSPALPLAEFESLLRQFQPKHPATDPAAQPG